MDRNLRKLSVPLHKRGKNTQGYCRAKGQDLAIISNQEAISKFLIELQHGVSSTNVDSQMEGWRDGWREGKVDRWMCS